MEVKTLTKASCLRRNTRNRNNIEPSTTVENRSVNSNLKSKKIEASHSIALKIAENHSNLSHKKEKSRSADASRNKLKKNLIHESVSSEKIKNNLPEGKVLAKTKITKPVKSKESIHSSIKSKMSKGKEPKAADSSSALSKTESSGEKTISFEDIEKKIFEGKQPVLDKCSRSLRSTNQNKNCDTKSNNKSQDAVKNSNKNMNIESDFELNNSKKDISGASKAVRKNNLRKETLDKNKTKVKIDKGLKTKSSQKASGSHKSTKKIKKLKPKCKLLDSSLKEEVESNSDISDWEQVDELTEILKSKDNEKQIKNVQIELEARDLLWGFKKRRRRNEQEMIEDYLRKEINRSIREVHENMHKTHLLCLFAHGMYINSILHSETLLSYALSIIPKLYYAPKRLDISHLEKFLSWFSKAITIKSDKNVPSNNETSIEEHLEKAFDKKCASSNKELVLMFVATTRSIGMKVRFVQSLDPITWKPSSSALIKPKKSKDDQKDQFSNKEKIKDEEPYKAKAESEPKQKISKPKKNHRKMLSSDSELSDFVPEPKKRKLKISKHSLKESPSTSKSSTNSGTSNRRPSAEIEEGKKKTQKGLMEWAEVYVEEEEEWISVDVARNKIHCAGEIEVRSPNLAYVVAFNPDQTVKDVTKRYMSTWLSYKDKLRCDGKWWANSLKPFEGKKDRRSIKEDKDMEKNLKMQPLPKTISEYKNHPLYALQRHLLKFEAIYPPNADPIGFIRGEPVYSRDSVKSLNGRDCWFKEAKTVRVDEEPYKIVKARPKWDRSTCQVIKDRPLELFGEWQVEDYEPPVAKNGKVPRNEYGNVDLFKPCMLPRGCVHLPINGLNRIARKLNIDAAPAVTGFDFHSGSCHPMYDGFVVCEEFKDIIMDAWNQDQVEQVRKEEEKRLKRIYGNWKKLILGLTLKDRIKEKYGAVLQKAEEAEKVELSEASKKKKKIKQEDLNNELPSSTIIHHVPNLKIDFSTSAVEAIKKRKPNAKAKERKVPVKRIKQKHNSSTPSSEVKAGTEEPSTLSSDSEDEMSENEKKERIRTILRWNPEGDEDQGSDPGLSDDSDRGDGDESGTEDLKRSSVLLTPISEGKSEALTKINRRRKKTEITKRKIKLKTAPEEREMDLSSESDVEVNNGGTSSKRKSLRERKIKGRPNYRESGESHSDISVDESDTGDATYMPVTEKV